jgi:hypothetical protein
MQFPNSSGSLFPAKISLIIQFSFTAQKPEEICGHEIN